MAKPRRSQRVITLGRSMRVLITGAAGMLGHDVDACATAAGHEVVALPRASLDVSDAAAVDEIVGSVRPDCVINCAAWTDVDGAESSPEAALRVNGQGAGNVAAAAAACGAWTIHVSTDYVFDGSKTDPYVESDPVAPQSSYGRSKLAGELAVADAAGEQHTIVRSSWLFGVTGKCFPATILKAAGERDTLTVVDDQIGCPTYTGHLAPALVSLAQARVPGVLHVAAAGHCSWCEFAQEIVARAGLDCQIQPGKTADLARPAPRPAYSVLGTERPTEAPRLPDWHDGLGTYMSTYAYAA
jgi:dTDP-4-dehydrorhamnose reductase